MNPEGDIDPDFVVQIEANDPTKEIGFWRVGKAAPGYVTTIVPVGDGSQSIWVGGDFQEFRGQSARTIVKLDFRGDIDTDFNFAEGFDGPVRALSLIHI